MPATAKYLKNYSEREAKLLTGFSQCYQHAVCLPVFNEATDCLASLNLAADALGQKVLAIIVLNQSEDSPDCANNAAFSSFIKSHANVWQNRHLAAFNVAEHLDVLLVERFKPPLQIPNRQGVGLARKIAGDVACALHQSSQLAAPYFFSSDADVTFPKDYFTASFNTKENSAACLAFNHIASDSYRINKATAVYQKSLHDYRDNLAYAGSSYAFHTIGSCLVVAINAYCQVRGFPKKSAGEDFYLLNKLHKIRPVISLDAPVVSIQSRLSNRVPFGTGPAVEKLLQTPSALFFHRKSFSYLKAYLAFLEKLPPQSTASAAKALIIELPEICQGLAQVQDLEGFIDKLWQASGQATQRARQINQWFDAFRTLKALHYFSEQGFAKLSYSSWLTLNENTKTAVTHPAIIDKSQKA